MPCSVLSRYTEATLRFYCVKICLLCSTAVEKGLFVNVSRINHRRGRIHTWQWNLQPPRYQKCADYFKYRVVFCTQQAIFFFLFIIQVLLSTVAHKYNEQRIGSHPAPFLWVVLCIKCRCKVYHYIIILLPSGRNLVCLKCQPFRKEEMQLHFYIDSNAFF